MRKIQVWNICCSMHISRRPSKKHRQDGGAWLPQPSPMVFRSHASPRRLPISTGSAAKGFQPICCRHSATISAPIPTKDWTNHAVSFSTPTGPAGEGIPPQRPIACRDVRQNVSFNQRNRSVQPPGRATLIKQQHNQKETAARQGGCFFD